MSEGKAINYYLNRMTVIDAAEIRRDYLTMFRLLLSAVDTMHPLDRGECKDTIETLSKYIGEIELINGRNYNHTLQLRGRRAGHFYYNGGHAIKLIIYSAMWEGGYLSKDLFRRAVRPG